MSSSTFPHSETERAWVDLRQQAHYWQALHGRAVEREQQWKGQAQQLEALVQQQTQHLQEQQQQWARLVEQHEKHLAERDQQIEALKARVIWLEQQVFGRKSEESAEAVAAPSEPSTAPSDRPSTKRRRGQQRGAQGHGRQRRVDLPIEEIEQPLPADQQQCPQCGLPLEAIASSEDSEEIDWQVRLVRRVHKRRRYRPTCDCRVLPGLMTAPVVPKVIRKGLFSTGFWVRVLLEKYLFQRPLARLRQVLALDGLSVSQGTLTGGLQRLGELLQPLYGRLLEHSRAADHWKMDETRWMVFEEVAGKQGHTWWLWVVVTRTTCVYLLDPSRSSEVPKQHLGEGAEGILNVDRYSAYKALDKKIRLAFCWSHIRRDFVRVRDGYETLGAWAEAWIERINALFHGNQQRLAVGSDETAFVRADQAVRSAVDQMAQIRDEELAQATLHTVQRKTLESLQRHWPGATIFVDHPDIPMDNNEAERCLRTPVVGRKNYYGSGSVWSGVFTAIVFSLTQTYLRNQLDPQQILLAYFNACAHNGGKPLDDLEPFLPWKLSEEQKRAWALPKQPP